MELKSIIDNKFWKVIENCLDFAAHKSLLSKYIKYSGKHVTLSMYIEAVSYTEWLSVL